MKLSSGKLPPWILMRVLLRSFLLQASWNFERMQSLGVLYVLAPALRVFYRDEDLVLACQRHLTYFNTHPFLASPILGTTLALEEKRSRNEAAGSIDVDEFKAMIMAPYAAMGDAFFWGGIRPLAACVALYIALQGALWAPVVFLVLFNVPHLAFRIGGLVGGYTQGVRLTQVIQRFRLPDLAIRCKEGTVIFLGGLCASLVFKCLQGEKVWSGWGFTAIPVVVLLGWLGRKGVSNLILILIFSGILLLLAR
ncbi:PTS system mannose/fructose/sorbose family transporter subunit IID [Trichloromonas sp.]|uniref:PTS system mannose/fructose/sorbose family transporter subunit IID n=1 Tax=Trichloromonas sp. TaxID=3069249 RepID=UPI003D817FE7